MVKTREQQHWLSMVFRVKGSVIPGILNQVILCGAFGVLISIAYLVFKLPVNQPGFSTVIPSVVLGLLLVFRTNTAYERFWEGRRLWATIVTQSVNVSRQIWSGAGEIAPDDREKKIAVLRLLVAFAIATRLYLRGEPVNAELQELMSPSQYFKLKTVDSPPLEIILLIGDYIQQQFDRKTMQPPQVVPLQQSVNMLVDSWIGCERILRTPMPLAYAIHLKQLVFLFCLLLPFQLVGQIGWLTGPTLAIVSFTLFGIEKIGIEIENPFGYDANDLPLDGICNNLRQSIENIISFEPK